MGAIHPQSLPLPSKNIRDLTRDLRVSVERVCKAVAEKEKTQIKEHQPKK